MLINHQALFRLLTKVLKLPNEKEGIVEGFEAYEALLKAILAENSLEMHREKEIIGKIDGDAEIRNAMIIMQQDILNIDQFGENKKELEKDNFKEGLYYVRRQDYAQTNTLRLWVEFVT